MRSIAQILEVFDQRMRTMELSMLQVQELITRFGAFANAEKGVMSVAGKGKLSKQLQEYGANLDIEGLSVDFEFSQAMFSMHDPKLQAKLQALLNDAKFKKIEALLESRLALEKSLANAERRLKELADNWNSVEKEVGIQVSEGIKKLSNELQLELENSKAVCSLNQAKIEASLMKLHAAVDGADAMRHEAENEAKPRKTKGARWRRT